MSVANKAESSKPRILVVDDHDASRYATSRILRAAGFDTVEAATGGEALSQVTENIDLVVLDVNLPDMDGFEVCRRLRNRPETAYLPVTYLSATFTSSTDMAHGLLAGADCYLAHPADPLVLTATVRALLFARDADAIKRRANARFRTVFELASSGIAILDGDMVFTDVNPAFCELAGRDRDELLRQPFSSLLTGEFIHQAAIVNNALADKKNWDGIIPIARGDGTRGAIEWRIVVEADTGARVAMATDITQRLRYEEERERLLASERVARAEAERSNHLKDEFLATLSHELRNPLGAILGWANVLRRTPNLPEPVRQGIEVIERNSRIQSHLTSDLLDFAGIRFGKMRLEMAVIDPSAIVDAAVEVVASQAEAKRIRISTKQDARATFVMGDEARLQQVAWNLLSNAIKFTPVGGQVSVSSRVADGYFELDVTDTGKGISPEFLPKLFERFSQQDSGSSKSFAGLGIGLTIVKHLVELHDGFVEAFSNGEGEGATFRIRIPVTTMKQASPTAAFSSRLAGIDVLIVEDAEDSRTLIARLLQDAGARVREAESADAALAEIDRAIPNVLISDIGMARKDGYQLIRSLRAAGYTDARLPAIALTAFVRAEDRSAALEAGFQMHLGKPINSQALIAAVGRLATTRTAPTTVA